LQIVLAVDGLKIRLPNTPEVMKELGSHPYHNTIVEGENAFALASVLHNTHNNIALEAVLTPHMPVRNLWQLNSSSMCYTNEQIHIKLSVCHFCRQAGSA